MRRLDKRVFLPGTPFKPRTELALRETGAPSLLVALGYLELLAELKPERHRSRGAEEDPC